MTLRRDDRIIRVGDLVEVTRAHACIKRIGYPLIFTELRDEASKSPEADAICKVLFGNSFASGLSLRSDPTRIPIYIVDAVAKAFVEKRRFGGNERTIHYYPPDPEPKGHWLRSLEEHPRVGFQSTVTKKFLAKTGTRYPAWGKGEEYEDGGLKDMKTHVILELEQAFKIEVTDVKLIRRANHG